MDFPKIETVFLWSFCRADQFKLLLCLCLGHFIAEFAIVNHATSRGRSPSGIKHTVPWYYLLLGHCSTHAAQVYILTGSGWLSIAELFCHAIIDYLNDEDKISIHIDQLAHLACKAVWVILVSWPPPPVW